MRQNNLKSIGKFSHFNVAMKKNQARIYAKGFTLIELLVVISIIGLLASVVLTTVNSGRGKARWARMMTDFVQIARAEEFLLDQGNFYSCDSPPGFDPSWNSGGRYSPASELGITCWDRGIVELGFLSRMPASPCPGWDYDWENWSPAIALPTGGGQVVRITLRGPASAYPSLYYYCMLDTHGSTLFPCGGRTGDAGYTLGGVMVNGVTSGTLSC